MKLNNKGFTLIEILAVIVIISVLGGIAVMGVLSSINNSKEKSYELFVSNVITASNQLYDEVNNSGIMGTKIYQYTFNCTEVLDSSGVSTGVSDCSNGLVEINNGMIVTNLQTLVSNGFLDGINNECMNKCSEESSDYSNCINSCPNKNFKIVLDPKEKKDVGNCSITIKKVNNKISIIASSGEGCPSQSDYDEVSNG